MSEIKILNKEKIKKRNKEIQLPVNFICIDEVSNDDAKIYIKQDVYEVIEEFSKSDITHERGGILLGDYIEDNNKMNIIISAFIEAKDTDATASTLTFTHRTWDYIHTQREELYPDLKIVGWQHTHPNYGIFLSNYDIFIQENFFNLPWQVAYVVDPVTNTRGFFQWRNDKVDKTDGFYVYDEVGKNIRIRKRRAKRRTKKKAPSVFSMISCTAAALFAAGATVLYFNKTAVEEKYNQLVESNTQITQENEQLQRENKALKNDSAKDTNKQQEGKKAEKSETQNQDDIVKFKVHIVKSDDTLQKICEENGLDYASYKRMILKINGITDENTIIDGAKLYIPVK